MSLARLQTQSPMQSRLHRVAWIIVLSLCTASCFSLCLSQRDARAEEPEAAEGASDSEVEEKPWRDSLLFQDLRERYERPEHSIEEKKKGKRRKRRMKKKDKRRLAKVVEMQRRRGWQWWREHKPGLEVDPRGTPELIVCSVNLNNYSTAKQVKKATRGKEGKKSRLRKKERSVVDAIKTSGCEVIALQGVVGAGIEGALEGLERLQEQLSEGSQEKWKYYLGDSNHKKGFNAFLVQGEQIEVVTVRHLENLALAQFEQFTEDEVFRGPIELELKVKSEEHRQARTVYLLNFHFRKNLKTKSLEPEQGRMQMAESLRRHVRSRQTTFTGANPPIYVVLGDREGGKAAPATQILEGRIGLKDFHSKGACRLLDEEAMLAEDEGEEESEEEEEPKKRRRRQPVKELFARCEDGVSGPKLLIGLIGENFIPPVPRKQREVDGEMLTFYSRKAERERREKVRAQRERRSEIYVVPFDLRYVYRSYYHRPMFASGVEEIERGSENSPLVWARINW